jgi:spore coat protein U-like protein
MRTEVTRARGAALVRILAVLAVMVVTATVAEAGNCKFVDLPSTIAFGAYSPFGSFLDQSTTFSVRCSANTTGSLRLSMGSAGTYFPRTMSDGPANKLGYNLYLDSAASIVWGDGTSGTTQYDAYNTDPKEKVFLVTIYGRIPAGMDAAPGLNYTDTITASLYVGGSFDESTTFQVTASIASQCTVESFSLNFGNYDPAGTNAASALDATTSVVAYCTKGSSATISLSPGSHYLGGSRRMAGPAGEYLRYNLFTDIGRTTEWNTVNTVARTSTSKTIPLGGAGGVTGYGRIPAAENVRAGNYTDTVVATVNY